MGEGKEIGHDELIEEFIRYEEAVDRSIWTIKSLGYTLQQFFSEIKKVPTEVDCKDLENFFLMLKNRKGRGGKPLHPESIRKHINNLSSFFNYLEMEEYIKRSPVIRFRLKYMRPYLKSHQGRMSNTRQLIPLDDMRKLIRFCLDPRDKAILLVLAKTGIRAGELLTIEVDDINWKDWSIKLKENNKRTNLIVFFDKETEETLRRWIKIREISVNDGENILFITNYGKKMSHATLNKIVQKYAEVLGFHNPNNYNLEARFSSHCLRHLFTTVLRKAGMPREYVMELRGDTRSDTMDIYYHISTAELREAYLKYMPTFGV